MMKLENTGSRIDMQTHAPCDRDGFRNRMTLTFDLWVNACRATDIEYICTKFGSDSSSRLPFRALTNRQTDTLHAGG